MASNATSSVGESPAATSTWRQTAFIALCVLTLVGWAPVASVVLAGTFASVFGCTLNEGDSHPCIVAGIDWGEVLYTLGVAGWLMLVTWPLIVLTFVAWIVVAVLYLVRRRSAQATS